LKKSRLVPKRTMKFSQSQKRTGVGATLKNAIEPSQCWTIFSVIFGRAPVFFRELWYVFVVMRRGVGRWSLA
jgi:hypothetical protein